MIARSLRGTLVAAVVAAGLATTAAPASAALPVKYNVLSAGEAILRGPNTAPTGANDWSCKPTAAHPRPVVLVHATFVNMGLNWNALSPLLKNDGYCVFAFNYGMTALSVGGYVGGLGSVAKSAETMAAFVDRVRDRTGVDKVDVVGHSQGGMVIKYHNVALGNGGKVANAVMLAPSMHGTTQNGLTTFGEQLRPFAGWLVNGIYVALGAVTPGLRDQAITSPFAKALNALPDTTSGTKLTVISTKYDTVVTPYATQEPKGPGTQWIVLQDQCALDKAGHVAVGFDSIALRNVANALDPATAKPIVCKAIDANLGG
ncbi:MAG: alpha/beta fold hydrolase [Solirubrobacteraceae bacterium]|nr:alpha/beta fold hydrolase [Solirubrobacteraceae bacterium]